MYGRARGLENIQIRLIAMVTTAIARKGRNQFGKLGLSTNRCRCGGVYVCRAVSLHFE